MTFSYGSAQKGYTPVRFDEKETVRFTERELVIGAGKFDALSRRKLITLIRKIIACAKQYKLHKLSLTWTDIEVLGKASGCSTEDLAQLFAENTEMANFEFRTFKTKPKDGWNDVTDIVIDGASSSVKAGIRKGQCIGDGVNACRELANTPGSDMTPEHLAQAAKAAARGTKVKVKVLGVKEMTKLGMGAILGVAKGSEAEPRFIILEYKGGKASEKPLVLAGKGITFDTGGLNIKTGDYMLEMHMDMSGGASVIWALVTAAKLGLKKNVIALVPAAENMPSGASYRPGDVLKSLSGKMIEILNTDAEGRVVLADALTYAKRYNPRLVVDVATLTGAALSALGVYASAIMTRDEKLETLFRELGEESGDYVWPLPLWDEYEDAIKSNFGDIANVPISNGRYAGSINGGMFLYQFAKDYPWVHIDMAPRMTSAPGEHLGKGAAGAPVRLLIKLIERF